MYRARFHEAIMGGAPVMMTDDKPTISLAAERKARERDFTAERELLIKELLEIGQSPEKAAAIAQDMLYYDWSCASRP